MPNLDAVPVEGHDQRFGRSQNETGAEIRGFLRPQRGRSIVFGHRARHRISTNLHLGRGARYERGAQRLHIRLARGGCMKPRAYRATQRQPIRCLESSLELANGGGAEGSVVLLASRETEREVRQNVCLQVYVTRVADLRSVNGGADAA